ncbi:hypothetical protein [Entomospira culicis]|uniref:Uncharacterized protein n=1 Tax=Entomospira culicis TaxID=2719989 RepID=A0A968GES2_9SPIO|nr:hypothetical protein [Entomospira culicis]NIZ18989.1 hypothetical protein [Entomospira culicis]NIZ69204.1 hypothetical protein [Entomospira culicis]WDI37790.1 hypothetical protein PVA46_03115 [Entomospira culicis]WDI39418.1 hypothetical protein PVA47_03120 [Entomospira culicis]
MKRLFMLMSAIALISLSCTDKSPKLTVDPQAIEGRDALYEHLMEMQGFYESAPSVFDAVHENTTPYPNTYSDYKKPNAKISDNLLKELFTPEQIKALKDAGMLDINTPLGFYTAIILTTTTELPEYTEENEEEVFTTHYRDVTGMLLGSKEIATALFDEEKIGEYINSIEMAIFQIYMSGSMQIPGLEGAEFSLEDLDESVEGE